MKFENQSNNALAKLRGYYPFLSPSEAKVGDFILKNPERVIRMTLAEIAEHSEVSGATALRLCRTLGYEGWLEFKIAITRSIPVTSQLIHDDIKEADPPGLIAQKVLRASIQAMEDTLAVFDEGAFTRAVDMIADARRVLIVGVGTSGPMAHEMFNRLFRLGINCWVQTDSYLQVMQAALLTKEDVAVVISQTGDSHDPIRTASEAKLNGCGVIAITGNALSLLAQTADVVLLSVSHETRAETTASRVAQQALIYALYVALAMRSVSKTIEADRAIWEALMRKKPFQAEA